MRGWREKLYNYKSRLDLQYLFITALVVRLIYLALMLGQVEYSHLLEIAPDTIRYVNIAEGVLGLDAPDENAIIIFGPGYGFFLSLVFFLFGKSALVTLLIQILMSSLSCLLIYKLGKELTKSKAVGLIAGYLLAFSFTSISLANIVLSDTLFFFLFLLGNLLFLIGLKNENRRYLIFSGIILGLSVYVRSIGQMWPVAMFFLIFILPVKNKYVSWWKSRLVRLKLAWIVPAIVLVLISGWMIRNYIVHDYLFNTFASAGGPANVATIALENVEGKSALEILTAWDEEYRKETGKDTLNRIDQYEILSHQAQKTYFQYPGEMIGVYWNLIWVNLNEVNNLFRAQLPEYKWQIVERVNQYLDLSLNYLCFWLSMVGFAAMIIKRQWKALFVLLTLYIYFAMMIGFTRWQGSRLFYPGQIAALLSISFLLYSISIFVQRVAKTLCTKYLNLKTR